MHELDWLNLFVSEVGAEVDVVTGHKMNMMAYSHQYTSWLFTASSVFPSNYHHNHPASCPQSIMLLFWGHSLVHTEINMMFKQ